MIKKVLSILAISFIIASAFTEDTVTGRSITRNNYWNESFVFEDVKQLESSYWIKEFPFSHLDHDKPSIEFNTEFIFLSDSRYLEIETMWTAEYVEFTGEYILDSSLVSIEGEFSYSMDEHGNMENDFYIMKISDNKLIVYDKIAECENTYICRDKAM